MLLEPFRALSVLRPTLSRATAFEGHKFTQHAGRLSPFGPWRAHQQRPPNVGIDWASAAEKNGSPLTPDGRLRDPAFVVPPSRVDTFNLRNKSTTCKRGKDAFFEPAYRPRPCARLRSTRHRIPEQQRVANATTQSGGRRYARLDVLIGLRTSSARAPKKTNPVAPRRGYRVRSGCCRSD